MPPRVIPEALHYRTACDAKNPGSVVRDNGKSTPPREVPAFSYLAWARVGNMLSILTHGILCFSGGPSPPRRATRDDQQNIVGTHGWWYFFILSVLLSFCSPYLFSIPFIVSLSFSHTYYQVKPILLILAYELVCTLIWAESFLIALIIESYESTNLSFIQLKLGPADLCEVEILVRSCCHGTAAELFKITGIFYTKKKKIVMLFSANKSSAL